MVKNPRQEPLQEVQMGRPSELEDGSGSDSAGISGNESYHPAGNGHATSSGRGFEFDSASAPSRTGPSGRRDRSRDGKPFKEKVLHVTGAIFGQPKLREPQDSWDDGSRLLSVGSSTDPAHLTSFEELPPEKRKHPIPRVQRYYMVVIFTLTASLLFADQNLLAPNLTMIAQEFNMNAIERDRYLGGVIAASFFAVGAPAALLVGYLCDKVNRRDMLFVVVILGEGPCLATYWVRRYWQLLVVRILTGISVGGTFPLVFSLVGDLFFPHQRAGVAAGIQLATGAGFAAGQFIAGFVGPSIGWRWPFIIVAAPAVVCAFLMLFTVKEPPRGASEDALQKQYAGGEAFEYSERITLGKVVRLLKTPSAMCCVLQGVAGSLPWGVLLTFINDYLSQQQHLSVAHATLVVSMWGLGGGLGVLATGILGQWLYNWRKGAMPLYSGLSIMVATVPILWLINGRVAQLPLLAMFVSLVGGALSAPPGPCARAVLLNVNEPEIRGLALALQTVLDDVGRGMGPFLVAMLIGRLGRRGAFNVSVLGWLPCGCFFILASLFVHRDEAAMQTRLAAKVVAVPLPQNEADGSFAPSPETASPTKPFGTGTPPELPMQAHEGINHNHAL